jgi:hypothetical protein
MAHPDPHTPQLSDKDLDEFIAIYHQVTGIQLARAEALEQAIKLLNFMRAVCKAPTPPLLHYMLDHPSIAEQLRTDLLANEPPGWAARRPNDHRRTSSSHKRKKRGSSGPGSSKRGM